MVSPCSIDGISAAETEVIAAETIAETGVSAELTLQSKEKKSIEKERVRYFLGEEISPRAKARGTRLRAATSRPVKNFFTRFEPKICKRTFEYGIIKSEGKTGGKSSLQ